MICEASLLLSLFAVQESQNPFRSFTLNNGLEVFVGPAAVEGEIQVSVYFRGGFLAEDLKQLGIGRAVLEQVCSSARQKQNSMQVGASQEIYCLSWKSDLKNWEAELSEIGRILWTRTNQETGQAVTCEGRAVGESPRILPSLQRALFQKSPYRNASAPLQTQFSEAQRQRFLTDYFHPRNGILVLQGLSEVSHGQLENALGQFSVSNYSTALNLVEEWPKPSSAETTIGITGDRVNILCVFPAPARGSADWSRYYWIHHALALRFHPDRVFVWAGVGTGLLWVEYETAPERFLEVRSRFLKEIDEALESLTADPFQNAGMFPRSKSAFALQDIDRMASDYLWGAGPRLLGDAAEGALVRDASEVRRMVQRYCLNRFLFVFWPDSEKEMK